MLKHEWINITRDVDALLIPSATPVTLRAGEPVLVTQALGGAFTVQIGGNLARVEGKDADALGLDNADAAPTHGVSFTNQIAEGPVDQGMVLDQLRTCFDPEIPVNIVDLGLIYRCDVIEVDNQHNRVEIDMTLTAPGCGMGPVLVADVQTKVAQVPNVTEVDVQLVFDPPWDRSRMSEEAQLQLGLL
ncbi:MAG: putative Fe-S cluster assembly protein SufT [Gammaproteobacteria bacterium]